MDVVVYDTQSERALPAQQVARILAETQTQFALRFAGVFIADATAGEQHELADCSCAVVVVIYACAFVI